MNIELSDDAIVDLAREGGIAFIPRLRGKRRFALSQLPEPQKQHVCTVLQQALLLGEPEEQAANIGRGDQRYFRIQITYTTHRESGAVVILVPEAVAPPDLQALWHDGQ